MDYRYLQARGALNDPGARSGRPRPSAPALWRGRPIPFEVLDLLPESVVREHQVFPIAIKGERLTIAAVDPNNLALQDKLSFLTARQVRLVPAAREEIVDLINRHYGPSGRGTESVDSMLQEFTDTALTFSASPVGADEDIDFAPNPTRSSPVGPPPSVDQHRSRAAAAWQHQAAARAASAQRSGSSSGPPYVQSGPGLDPIRPLGGSPGVFTYVVEEGQRVLMRRPNGTMEILVGPRRIWHGRNTFRAMMHYVAHPGEYLIVRYRDGGQEHLPGPSEVWFDPRIHQEISREDALQVAAKEAVVVYSSKEGTAAVQRRIEYGPTLFIPRPGEWLHTFAWHASAGGSHGVRKVPRGLVFQKLWLMPDQMYHDVADVRTADDAVLTIRLMLFFELLDIERMLEATHDPIGDFVNAATSDVVDFTGRHDFESFKRNTDKLNELETYRQLTGRAAQCGYRINKVVYRGYGAPERLQQMHDQAIEARTKLQLERATEQQSQQLEDYRLDSQLARAAKRRHEQSAEVAHELELARSRDQQALQTQQAQRAFRREQDQLDIELRDRLRVEQDARRREHLSALRDLGVDLTAYLTQGRADRVIELRGSDGATHLHLASDERPAPEPR